MSRTASNVRVNPRQTAALFVAATPTERLHQFENKKGTMEAAVSRTR
jgi:hypothetical protein